jgi:hypothetical protein
MRAAIWGIVILLTGASFGYAQSVYTDPDGYYKLQVPPGWQAQTQANGLNLLKGSAFVSVVRMKGQGTPQSLVEFFAQRIKAQWKMFEGASAGDSQVGGRPGTYAWFTGINPKGNEAVLKIVATTDAESGYVMLLSAPRSDFGSTKADFERIEAGLELTKSK